MKSVPTTTKSLRKKTRGQGMTEYIIVVALIAIAAIGVISLFGDNIRKLFGASSTALSGNESVDPGTKDYQSSGTNTHKKMDTFGKSNAPAY